MAEYKVFVSEPAENDLRDIIRYIAAQFSAPVTAMKILGMMDEAIQELSDMPEKYPLVTDERLAAMGYRKRIVKNYIIFFTIHKKIREVDVERILYARRDWNHIL